ncbi:Cell fate regulator YaaT, PSP1 superfamily (controls sporulation, competence, biofilm development) [Arachidicoccus rhizosphaerae]|uniref:Cell fate regulator YaaT, PSP1 superfamily (Controls sporulation, competence, biofilm development) n=1 Tax=Arachidicoccus rhizosphaerae TaxID=551991 RepID=A0A1H4CJG0_9BACT|nr:regulatory iron-sulfur-containing complex subunit RicT [Arachidicoccus rhizosphaerae]SEA60565.1 Cell fate regulator YaaT, PSP1 superfamily (controls sporulation, competence, biofilm development) [Arachidicoccus rhizosphaerae]
MGCGSCGTKPNGCKSNGGCSTGSCNRLNVHDWLMNLPMSDEESSCKIVELSFKNGSRKDFFRNNSLQHFEKGEYVTIEGVSGFDVGEISLTGELVRVQMKKKGVKEFSPDIKKILRRSSDRDIELFKQSKDREQQVLMRSREIARDLKLAMKLSEVEIQADGKKATFFYTADERVDFREMIKAYASEFKVKVEMRQIGIRQEAGKVGGIGSCGRELCCSTWLTDFKSVNTTAARYQNLSINQTKLSGQCGRLKCCLNYELDTYLDALQHFPNNADKLEIQRGRATLVKKDIFKDLMWYTLPDSNKQYPLTLKRVREILRLNAEGDRPENLEAVELVGKAQEIEPSFVDVVGQISLRSLERSDRKRKNKSRNERGDRGTDRNQDRNDRNSERGERSGRPQSSGANGNEPVKAKNRKDRFDRSANDRNERNNERGGNDKERPNKPGRGNNNGRGQGPQHQQDRQGQNQGQGAKPGQPGKQNRNPQGQKNGGAQPQPGAPGNQGPQGGSRKPKPRRDREDRENREGRNKGGGEHPPQTTPPAN